MRILVAGGRDFNDKLFIFNWLDEFNKSNLVTELIEGDAKGVDRISGYWARKNKITNRKFPAEWDKYKKSAGVIRNKKMLNEGSPDLVIIFPGGRGTQNMKKLAEGNGYKTIQVNYKNNIEVNEEED